MDDICDSLVMGDRNMAAMVDVRVCIVRWLVIQKMELWVLFLQASPCIRQ